MWQKSLYKPEYCEQLPAMFADGASVTKVCVALGICRDTYYEWKKVHPEFASAAKLGEQRSQIWWEDKGKGGVFGEIDKFAGSSWQFVMKNRFKECYQPDNTNEKPVNETLLEKLLEKL